MWEHIDVRCVELYIICLFLGVKQACSEFLEKQLDPSNCLGIHQFAENHSADSLREAAETFTYKYFQSVVQHDEFKSLSLKEVKSLIGCEEIQVRIMS